MVKETKKQYFCLQEKHINNFFIHLNFLPMYGQDVPALIQVVFHIGDHFWMRVSKSVSKKLKKHFFSRISSIL